MAASVEAGGMASHYGASFFVQDQAVVTAWTEVEFTDRLSQNFIAGHMIFITSGGFAVEISFDPRVSNKAVHGYIPGNDKFQLNFKHARSVYIRRAEGVDTTVNIWAWR